MSTGELFGPYRVGARLGRGGMGEVHEAYDTVRERTVALKRVLGDVADDADVRERFRREWRIAATLDSPHVVPVHDFGVIDDRLFIDMRLVRGRDLGALIEADGPLPPERAVGIVAQVADALDAAHDAGIVHRDVKPSNVLLAARDFVYLADFGIVHVREATESPRLTATGSTLGSPPYMAPEQLRGAGFDRRLDVYALGCVLTEALTGRPPFVGERTVVMLGHLHDDPPRPSDLVAAVPPALDEVVLAALAKDPQERPATAGAFAAAAQAALVRSGVTTEARTYDARPPRPRSASSAPPPAGSPPVASPSVAPSVAPPQPAPVHPPTPARAAPALASPAPASPAASPAPAPTHRPAPADVVLPARPGPGPVRIGPSRPAPPRAAGPASAWPPPGRAPHQPLPRQPAPREWSPPVPDATPPLGLRVPLPAADGRAAGSSTSAPRDPGPHSTASRGVLALVLAVLLPPVGAVLGLRARRGDDRRGTAALVLGSLLTVAAVVGTVLLLRTPAVSTADLEAQVVAQSGLDAGQVDCPDALPATVDASVVCTATAPGGELTLRARVIAVSGTQVNFEILAE